MTKVENPDKFNWSVFLKALMAIGLPVAFQNLLTTTATMVDTMMIAPLGELNVGALGLCGQFSSLMFSSYWGFVGGGMMFFSQYYGAKDEAGIRRSYGMTWTFMMTVGVLFGCLAIFAPNFVMRVYTDKVSLQQIGAQYLHIIGFAYMMQVFSMAVSCLLRSTARVKIPMVASIASVASNLFFNYALIYGKFGMPQMGIRGAALASVIAAAVNLAVIYILAIFTGYPYLFGIRSHFKWSRAHLKEYLIKCFPIICNELLLGISNMLIYITLGRQPESVIDALAVFRTIEGMLIGFFAGFSNAASVLVGTCVGAGEPKKAFERAKRLVYMCSGVIAFVNVVILCLHGVILRAMHLSGDSYRIGTVFITIFAVVSVIRMGNWMQNDTYRASGDAVTGTVLEIVCMYVIVLPCVLLAGFKFHAPYWLIFMFCYIDEPFRYIFMQRHFYSKKWIRPVTDVGKAAMEEYMKK